MEQRPGMIEIDLACGTRLRVDAFVNERALRRVLSVLKVSS
jgi:transposase